jgi:Tubulin-tyrosine ligase family
MDPRTSIFYTKRASFHTFHKMGSHFACWGQSYNHIPGHAAFTRKDLLVTSANNYLKKWNRFA